MELIMEYTTSELRAMLRAQEQAERELGVAEFKAIPRTFEWKLETIEHGFRVSCRYDETTRAAIVAWREKFPTSGQPLPNLEWHGMTYTMLYTLEGEPRLIGGGGSVILNLKDSFNPAKITRAQAESFRAGVIPEELKKPW
jgi:hypothetical protein